MNNYGKELILDLHECNTDIFNKEGIQNFFDELCGLIDMVQRDVHWWEEGEPNEPHLVGTSAVQFIQPSNIVIHTLPVLKRVYLNIFSCKDFDADEAIRFCYEYFDGVVINSHIIDRI